MDPINIASSILGNEQQPTRVPIELINTKHKTTGSHGEPRYPDSVKGEVNASWEQDIDAIRIVINGIRCKLVDDRSEEEKREERVINLITNLGKLKFTSIVEKMPRVLVNRKIITPNTNEVFAIIEACSSDTEQWKELEPIMLEFPHVKDKLIEAVVTFTVMFNVQSDCTEAAIARRRSPSYILDYMIRVNELCCLFIEDNNIENKQQEFLKRCKGIYDEVEVDIRSRAGKSILVDTLAECTQLLKVLANTETDLAQSEFIEILLRIKETLTKEQEELTTKIKIEIAPKEENEDTFSYWIKQFLATHEQFILVTTSLSDNELNKQLLITHTNLYIERLEQLTILVDLDNEQVTDTKKHTILTYQFDSIEKIVNNAKKDNNWFQQLIMVINTHINHIKDKYVR